MKIAVTYEKEFLRNLFESMFDELPAPKKKK